MTDTAPSTDLSQKIADAQPPERRTARDLLASMEGEFAKALPAHLPVERFMRLALTEVNQSSALAACTPQSLLGALVTAAQLGLEPGGPLGQFYLTPRKIKGVMQVVPIVGYQGLRDLAYRSGQVDSIQAVIVREGDVFRRGADADRGIWFEWEPAADDDDSRPMVGVLAVARIRGAGTVWRYLTRQRVLERRDRGSAGQNGPWASDFDAMALKTALRDLAKDLPKSTALAVATQVDETVQEAKVQA